MAKRKVHEVDETSSTQLPRRSTRRKTASNTEISSAAVQPVVKKSKQQKPAIKSEKDITGKEEVDGDKGAVNGDDDHTNVAKNVVKRAAKSHSQATPKKEVTTPPKVEGKSDDHNPQGRQYWLMKAEPETRLENGHDVRFSIDDLAAKTEPEPWDGIRAYAARNNLRAMKKGDLAFFYHSNCKVPGIVGIMEIVAEHTPDLSAHDPTKPYYDPSSKPEDPKWSVVHVKFRQKFDNIISLREMKDWQKEDDHPLKEMQMLKLMRMSVSKVRVAEWEFLVDELRKRGDVIEV